jgi:predicted component of type VI protein secretion system
MIPLLESKTDEHPSNLPVEATLVLASGSRAGTEAPLMVGYYMIGRSSECQVRPKSKSVSRRHCLVHHHGSGIRVFDLGSTSGTRINDQKVVPKTWVEVQDGDLVRLGKIGFHLHTRQASPTQSNVPSTGASDPGSDLGAAAIQGDHLGQEKKRSQAQEGSNEQKPNSIVTGQAWDSFDIAGFLDSQDQADQAERYQKIRQQHQAASDSDDGLADTGLSGEFIVVGGKKVASEEFASEEVGGEDGGEDTGEFHQTVVPESELLTQPQSETSDGSSKNSHAKGSLSAASKTAKSKTAKTSLADRFGSMFATDDPERRKIILAAILAVAVVLFAGYTFYQFTAGPPVRVLNEID